MRACVRLFVPAKGREGWGKKKKGDGGDAEEDAHLKYVLS